MEMLRRREAKIESLKPEQHATYALLFYSHPRWSLSQVWTKCQFLRIKDGHGKNYIQPLVEGR
jgi:hypothetical protein